MEPLVYTWTVNEQVASADLNSIQRNAMASRPANGGGNDILTVANGVQEVIYQASALLADATLLLIDDSIDWRDRFIRGEYLLHSVGNSLPGGGNDDVFSDGTLYSFWGYTGLGALDAGSNVVTNGNPPVPAAASSWACEITAGLWIYCDPTTGKLKIYNGTGASLNNPSLAVRCTADLGKR